jgi:hypothetical protein
VERAERQLQIVLVLQLTTFLPLIALAVVFGITLPQSGIAPVFVLLAIASRAALMISASVLKRRVAHLHYVDAGSSRWWFDRRNGAVEQSEQAPGPFRDGPYASRDDAERAPEIARRRAAAWNAEDRVARLTPWSGTGRSTPVRAGWGAWHRWVCPPRRVLRLQTFCSIRG